MNPSRPSTTAAIVAWARAAGDPHDTITRTLIPRAYARSLVATDSVRLGAGLSAATRRLISAGLVDHMRLRTAAIDHLLGRAVAQGVQQIVLLGAGLDARAHRLSGLEAVRVFEVDHPASQAYKRHKVERLPNTAAEVVYVPVDFERESLTDRLTACHFDAKSPSFWVWEGVTMYLDPAATDATLRAIAALAAPGSRAIATYMIPEPLGAASPWVHRALAILDEPLRGALTPR